MLLPRKRMGIPLHFEKNFDIINKTGKRKTVDFRLPENERTWT